jgi:hypothetical protein
MACFGGVTSSTAMNPCCGAISDENFVNFVTLKRN